MKILTIRTYNLTIRLYILTNCRYFLMITLYILMNCLQILTIIGVIIKMYTSEGQLLKNVEDSAGNSERKPVGIHREII